MIPKFLIGLGSGRCGTWTLHRILDAQPGVKVTHEGFPLPWLVDVGALWYRLLLHFNNYTGDWVGNVSFVWINYIGKVMGMLRDPRAICLKRPKDEVVDSFCRYIPYLNHWTDPKSAGWNPNKDTSAHQSVMWPKYDLPKKDAIALYWEDYYSHADWLVRQYPKNFLLMDMHEALNTEEGQNRLLDFAGLPEKGRLLFLDRKLNTPERPKGHLDEAYDNVIYTRSSIRKEAKRAG